MIPIRWELMPEGVAFALCDVDWLAYFFLVAEPVLVNVSEYLELAGCNRRRSEKREQGESPGKLHVETDLETRFLVVGNVVVVRIVVRKKICIV